MARTFSNLSTYLDSDNYIHVAASAANFGPGYEDNLDHNLVSYFVQLSNPDAGKKALGNSVDVYCYSPDNIVEASVTGTVSEAGQLILKTAPYICEIIGIVEELSQTELPAGDVQIFNTKPGESYSIDNEFTLVFDPSYVGASITVIYRTWSTGTVTNAFLNDPENRYPATSLKEKAMPLAIVSINDLEFSGPITVEQAQTALNRFINSIDDNELEKSDLVSELYTIGATGVSLNMSISIRQHDVRMNADTISMAGNSYVMPTNTFGRFYTNNDLLQGVTKV